MTTGWQPTADLDTLSKRARMLKEIRAFFYDRDVLEVETPILSAASTTDPHIDSLSTQFRQAQRYLNTSPEYAMKRLLASYNKPIYQIAKVFRDDEHGVHHNPEFTMLEWYRPGYDINKLMREIQDLVTILFGIKETVFYKKSYGEVFEERVGINPHVATIEACHAALIKHAIEIPVGMGNEIDEWLDWCLLQLVFPAFNKEEFTFLYDYPVSQCALAKLQTDANGVLVAKRFELFYGDLELANGFYELLDAKEQQQRFENENARRKFIAKPESNIDHLFIDALKHGLPECSGVALGLDRLLMVLLKKTSIDQVLSFSWANS